MVGGQGWPFTIQMQVKLLFLKLHNLYCIAGFYHKDFNIAFGSIRNIKIHVIFVKHNIFVASVPQSFFKQLCIDPL